MVLLLLKKNGRSRDADIKNRLVDTVGEGQGRMNRESSIEKYALPYAKLDSQWDLLYDEGNPNPVLFNNLEGWNGVGGEMEVQ